MTAVARPFAALSFIALTPWVALSAAAQDRPMQALLDAHKEADAALVADWAARDPQTTRATDELAYRVKRDQRVRQVFTEAFKTEGASPQDDPFGWLQLRNRMKAIDSENLEWLKAQTETNGWFTLSERGEAAEQNAFLIVQHATEDLEFMAATLDKFETLWREGEVSPDHYALLYDRVALADGRQQRYGSQTTCVAGEGVVFSPIEDPDTVDERRAEVGLPPLAEYKQQVIESTNNCAILKGG